MLALSVSIKREQSHVATIKSAKNGRESEGMCVLLGVLMWGKKPDKEHADPQSWLQSSPDKSVLHHTVMYPRAGSAEAATRTQAEPRDKSGSQHTKGDLLMHDMGLQTNVFVLHSMSCLILCDSQSHSLKFNTDFLQNVNQLSDMQHQSLNDKGVIYENVPAKYPDVKMCKNLFKTWHLCTMYIT